MASQSWTRASNVPVHRIDLDLPPRERYKDLALQYKPQIATITPLFNELLTDLGVPVSRHDNVNTVARWLLRRVHSAEETEELRGICEVIDVEMYLLVALNVVLDLLMGCTSSVVRSDGDKCWHLRTLDWGMDALRRVVVQLDFVQSKQDPGRVIASSVTYVGFVGVLTGVRPNLSMSLNFRGVHNADTRWGQLRFYAHHLAVLFGLRPSISSVLRAYLINNPVKSLDQLQVEVGMKHTTAAYLTFSDGHHALVLEKDFCSAESRRDVDGFIVATNHDAQHKTADGEHTPKANHAGKLAKMEAMRELIEDSKERSKCVSAKWHRRLRAVSRGGCPGITEQQAVQWVSDWPTTNETTHFAVVMDPSKGCVRWAYAYHEPVLQPQRPAC